jgi:hypothetical protein
MTIASEIARAPLPPAERRLLQDVRAAAPGVEYRDLTRDRLAEITTEKGIDWATALLHDRIRRAPWNRDFIERIEADTDDFVSDPHPDVLIAPGALYREQPRFGSDGRAVRAAAAELALQCRVIEVPSMGSVTGNAAMIAQSLNREPRPVIVASLSKGGSDMRIALERHPEIRGKVACWLNICGLIRGTPISDSLLGTRWWQRGLLRGYLACTRAHADFVRELAATPGSLLETPMNPDTFRGIRVISVVGFPLATHLVRNSKTRHARMARLGPNDGTSLLRDAIVEPGFVYPVWGADHFMRTPDVPRLMRRLLQAAEAA